MFEYELIERKTGSDSDPVEYPSHISTWNPPISGATKVSCDVLGVSDSPSGCVGVWGSVAGGDSEWLAEVLSDWLKDVLTKMPITRHDAIRHLAVLLELDSCKVARQKHGFERRVLSPLEAEWILRRQFLIPSPIQHEVAHRRLEDIPSKVEQR